MFRILRVTSFSRTILVVSGILFLASCASLPTEFERPESFALQDTATTRLAIDIEPLVSRHPQQSGFHLLNDGKDAFTARVGLIEAAEKSLDLQYYIWHDDLTGRVLHNRLLHAADRGVRVRLLLDDLDTAGKDAMLHTLDSHPGIEIRLFNPFANRSSRAAGFMTDLSRVNHRMHNKSLTADNRATIFGGRNIGDEYFAATEEGVAFGDLDVIGIGPVVNDVSAQFDLYWNSKWVYPISAFRDGESPGDKELEAFRQASGDLLQEARESGYSAALRQTSLASLKNIGELQYSWSRWILVYDDPSKVEAEEIKEDTHLAPSLLEAFEKTQSDLIVISPYFVPGDKLTDYFASMVERGVRVRILTNSLSANDVSIVHAGYMRYRKDLVEGGIELYEYKPTTEQIAAGEKEPSGWTGSARASLHAKSFVFDKRYMFVGSFNLDARSVALNTELGVYFESPEYAGMVAKNFDEKARIKTYKVELKDGDLVWVTEENGGEARFDKEPNTSWWTRFSTGFLSIFVIESQL